VIDCSTITEVATGQLIERKIREGHHLVIFQPVIGNAPDGHLVIHPAKSCSTAVADYRRRGASSGDKLLLVVKKPGLGEGHIAPQPQHLPLADKTPWLG